MRRNVGRLERKLRAAAGIILLAAAFFIKWPSAREGLGGAIGALLLASALALYCPINALGGAALDLKEKVGST